MSPWTQVVDGGVDGQWLDVVGLPFLPVVDYVPVVVFRNEIQIIKKYSGFV